MSNEKPIGRARALRQGEVPAEARLWQVLRNRGLGGFKFRRQHPIGKYVVDFACVACKVVVEADGETHLGRGQEDTERTREIEAEGWQVLRFWNTDVYDDMNTVEEAIYRECVRRSAQGLPPHPQPLSPGRDLAARPAAVAGRGRGEPEGNP